MSDPTDDLRDYEEALWDEVRRDIRDRENKGIEQYGKTVTDSTDIMGVNEAYDEILDAVVYMKHAQRAYNRMTTTLGEVTRELNRLKSLESYQEQQNELQALRMQVSAQKTQLQGYMDNPLHSQVQNLESQLSIARKANHLDELKSAQKRIIELEEKLEERDG